MGARGKEGLISSSDSNSAMFVLLRTATAHSWTLRLSPFPMRLRETSALKGGYCHDPCLAHVPSRPGITIYGKEHLPASSRNSALHWTYSSHFTPQCA